MIKPSVKATLPTKSGKFIIYTFPSNFHLFPHVVLANEETDFSKEVNIRIHSECMTGDMFGSLRCDCGDQLDYSLHYLHENTGLLIYLRQEGRGIGLENKLEAYNLQDEGLDTFDANLKLGFHQDLRSYEAAIEILESFKVNSVKLLTNNPEKINAFNGTSVKVVERLPIELPPNDENKGYLDVKRKKMGHMIKKYM